MTWLDSKYLDLAVSIFLGVLVLAIYCTYRRGRGREWWQPAIVSMITIALCLSGFLGAIRNRDNPPTFAKRTLLLLVDELKGPVYAERWMAISVNTYEQATHQRFRPWRPLSSNRTSIAKFALTARAPSCLVTQPSKVSSPAVTLLKGWHEKALFSDPLANSIEVLCRDH